MRHPLRTTPVLRLQSMDHLKCREARSPVQFSAAVTSADGAADAEATESGQSSDRFVLAGEPFSRLSTCVVSTSHQNRKLAGRRRIGGTLYLESFPYNRKTAIYHSVQGERAAQRDPYTYLCTVTQQSTYARQLRAGEIHRASFHRERRDSQNSPIVHRTRTGAHDSTARKAGLPSLNSLPGHHGWQPIFIARLARGYQHGERQS